MMLVGLYDNMLMLFGNIFNISYVLSNFMLYVSYGLGMFVSFICLSIGINYLLKKHRNLFDAIVLGLSISSILLLLIMTFKNEFEIIHLVIGIVMFFLGFVISFLFS